MAIKDTEDIGAAWELLYNVRILLSSCVTHESTRCAKREESTHAIRVIEVDDEEAMH